MNANAILNLRKTVIGRRPANAQFGTDGVPLFAFGRAL
jgi:hypothetical protein